MNESLRIEDTSRHTLYEEVADLLEDRIVSGEYPYGSRLPSEQALCEISGVSRTIVREALKLLKERGLIETRTGSGAYVTRPEARNISDVVARIINLDGIWYEDVFNVRATLEIESAGLAARNASRELIEELRNVNQSLLVPGLSVADRAERDFSFHYLLAKASGNPLLALLVEAIGGICRGMIERTSLLSDSADDGYLRHGRICDALEERNAEKAREAARDHLEESKRRYRRILEGEEISHKYN